MLDKIFTWWSGWTVGTLFDVKRRSDFIGEDDYGNRYFQDRKASYEGRHRRYVIYKGIAEPSKVPADWHGWLHYTFDQPPTERPFERKSFEIDHTPNLTGTIYAYRPKGSLSRDGERREADSDYQAWSPDA